MLPTQNFWTVIINTLIQRYLFNTTICIVWHKDIDFTVSTSGSKSMNYAIINLVSEDLTERVLDDIVNLEPKRKELLERGIVFNKFELLLTVTIEKSHCESFFAFQAAIPIFVDAFSRASKYSLWRSTRNKFIFGYYRNESNFNYFQHSFFKDQANMLLVEAESSVSPIFALSTNKYVGLSIEEQMSLYPLDVFDASTATFNCGQNLFPDKTKNLMGREIIMSGFDYRPYIVIHRNTEAKNTEDLGTVNSSKSGVLVDGTEAIVLLTFCEKYNCSIKIDSSEADDWGVIFPNMSGNGALGMVAKGKAEVAMGAMYSWQEEYVSLDMSMYLVRSGISCLVPRPKRLASLLLPLQPFQPILWAMVAVYLLIEIVSLFLARRLEQSVFQHRSTNWWQSFKFGYVTAFKLFLSQAGSAIIKSMGVRVLLFACFLNDIIITSIYGGGLASILTIPSFEVVPDSVAKLRESGLKWGANSEAWVSSLRNSDDPLVIEVLKNFALYESEKLAQLALKENMGFTIERLPFGHYAVEEFLYNAIDRLKIMKDDFYFQYTVAFVPRLWPLLERYNDLIYNWHSSGFDKFWEWRVVADNLNTQIQKKIEASLYDDDKDVGPVKLGMSNFVGILLVWIVGIAIATLAFLCELGWYKYQRRQENLKKDIKSRKENEVYEWLD